MIHDYKMLRTLYHNSQLNVDNDVIMYVHVNNDHLMVVLMMVQYHNLLFEYYQIHLIEYLFIMYHIHTNKTQSNVCIFLTHLQDTLVRYYGQNILNCIAKWISLQTCNIKIICMNIINFYIICTITMYTMM